MPWGPTRSGWVPRSEMQFGWAQWTNGWSSQSRKWSNEWERVAHPTMVAGFIRDILNFFWIIDALFWNDKKNISASLSTHQLSFYPQSSKTEITKSSSSPDSDCDQNVFFLIVFTPKNELFLLASVPSLIETTYFCITSIQRQIKLYSTYHQILKKIFDQKSIVSFIKF